MAQLRKSQIKEVSYDLFFDLKKDAKGYRAKSLINLELKRTDLPLSFDFVVDKIIELKVNGRVLKNFSKRNGSFDLPQKILTPSMTVEVDFQNTYSKESGGFLRAVDPEDGSEYLYTDFEPYYAHHLFPCFDQPDIKAIFKVQVKAPQEWKVIQNELISNEIDQGEFRLTTFQPTPKLSPYLFFLGAGPFVEWKDHFEKTPLFLYSRKSLEKYVDAKEIFKTTKAGLKFFNRYFDYPYPFSKYGQIFIPEFAWGGMENPGAVTLNERNIFRGAVPQSKYERRDNLILHEMAHMWFGDLVTMEWWNDLWLNESFATYLASVAQERALESKATWIDFFNTKAWGLWQDQLVTTHPIETVVPDVRTARGNFDGITYAKGASALKQLHFFVGEEGFKNGLQKYFKKFAFQNTQRSDFIEAIAEASKVNLSEWTIKWLQTAGLNWIDVKIDCNKNKIISALVIQNPSVSQTLSPHRMQIGFFTKDGQELESDSLVDITYINEKTPISEVVGKKCPDFIMPNIGDQDYAHFGLDENSLRNSGFALQSLPDSLSKNMLWNILAQMVRDQQLSPLDYLNLAMIGLKNESDDLLLGGILGRKSSLRDTYKMYLTAQQRGEVAPQIEKLIWERVQNSKPASSLQMIFFDFYLTIAQTQRSQDLLVEMLKTNSPPKGIILDQDRRWALISNLAENGTPEAKEFIQLEEKRDSSTLGKRMALGATAAFPTLKNKQEIWKLFIKRDKLSYSTFLEAAHRFHNGNFLNLSDYFVTPFFNQIQKMNWSQNDDIVDIYFEELFPVEVCTSSLLKRSETELKKAKNLTSLARRSWLEAQDELKRCVLVKSQK
jgi:aminopeptidase N